MRTSNLLAVALAATLSLLKTHAFTQLSPIRPRTNNFVSVKATTETETETRRQSTEGVKDALRREYLSFFEVFEEGLYSEDVKFLDPLNRLEGISAYKRNIDMLGGRGMLGRSLFSDARINLHSVTEPEEGRVRTRWTMSFTFKGLPWKPRPTFTGISDYTLDEKTGKILVQEVS